MAWRTGSACTDAVVDRRGRRAGLSVSASAAHLRAVAARHDTAADSIEAHVGRGGRLKDAIAAAERQARRRPTGRRVTALSPHHRDTRTGSPSTCAVTEARRW